MDSSAPGARRLSGSSAGDLDRLGFRPAVQLRFQTIAGIPRPAMPTDPRDPLPLCVKAAGHLFSELYRLKILELDFFTDDDKVVDRRALVPDPAVRRAFFQLLDDYAALIERRRFGSFSLSARLALVGTARPDQREQRKSHRGFGTRGPSRQVLWSPGTNDAGRDSRSREASRQGGGFAGGASLRIPGESAVSQGTVTRQSPGPPQPARADQVASAQPHQLPVPLVSPVPLTAGLRLDRG